MKSHPDEDFLIFAAQSAAIAMEYVEPDSSQWLGSPFEWILTMPSASKGKIGELLVSGWASSRGFNVSPRTNKEHDLVINGHKVEVKLSTLWEDGIFKFQQIRDQDYEFAFCIAISPFKVEAWYLPKIVLREHVIGHMGQHTGAGGSDTFWLSFPADKPFEWMNPWGGDLSVVAEIIHKQGFVSS